MNFKYGSLFLDDNEAIIRCLMDVPLIFDVIDQSRGGLDTDFDGSQPIIQRNMRVKIATISMATDLV